MIRFFLLILLSILFLLPVSAQYSVQSQYHSGLQNAPSVSALDGSIHYWTRLKKYRVEFLPGILYQTLSTDQENQQNLGVTFPVSFYLIDFVNDCDCPTFSKNSFWFQKGFFIRLTPSWATAINHSDQESYNQLLEAGISLGLDLGLSDLLTISPMIGYTQLHSLTGQHTHNNFIHLGVSVLFRHDYRRKYR